jgi:hypothetical protein
VASLSKIELVQDLPDDGGLGSDELAGVVISAIL